MGGARLLRYVVRRLLQAVPVVLGVVVLNFLLLQLAPGDAATVLAGEAGGAPLEYIQQLRQRFGLDQPVPVQLFHYVKNILTLDLGYSFRNASPVLPLILARLWPTLLLMGTALFISVAGGVVLGLLAAVFYRNEYDEPHRRCPTCKRVVPWYDAICTRCGTELEFPTSSAAAQGQPAEPVAG